MSEQPPVRIDVAARAAWLHGQPLSLPRLQFNLLVHLATHAGQVVTRAQLMREVWGTSWTADTKTLNMHVSWLRKHLNDDPDAPRYLITVRGVGFRLEPGTVELIEPPVIPDDPVTRVVLVKRGDVLVFGNVGKVSERSVGTASSLRDQLQLSAVLLFEGDIDMAALPGSAL